MWTQVLARAGLEVRTLDADHIQLQTPESAVRMWVQHRPRALAASQISAAPAPNCLMHLPRISEKALRAAEEKGWSVVTDDGRLSLLADDGSRTRREPAISKPPAARRAPGPAQYGRFAVVRRLLETGPQNQADLAQGTRMTQPRVSRILSPLRQDGLIARTAAGWEPANWDALCDWFLATYPGPGGVTTHWFSLDPPVVAAAAATAATARAGRVGVSGDVAADLILPWRRPEHVVVYAERGANLADSGFTPAVSPQDATMTFIVPKDPGVWLPRPWTPSPSRPDIELVDPVQILFDLYAASGSDAEQAAERWRQALQAGSLPDFLGGSVGSRQT